MRSPRHQLLQRTSPEIALSAYRQCGLVSRWYSAEEVPPVRSLGGGNPPLPARINCSCAGPAAATPRFYLNAS